MTPKEKAKELVEKYVIWNWTESICNYEGAKQCALIAVDEMIKVRDEFYNLTKEFLPTTWSKNGYLEQVKQEIQDL